MRYVIEVLTDSNPASADEWVLLASHDRSQPAIAAAAYDAAKHRYRRVRMRRDDGHLIVDSAMTESSAGSEPRVSSKLTAAGLPGDI